jgi:hypothetical protein
LMGTEFIRVVAAKPSRDWLRSTNSEAGAANSVLFPLLHMRFEMGERKLVDSYPAWTGVDGVVQVSDGTSSTNVAPFGTSIGSFSAEFSGEFDVISLHA